MKNVGSFLKVPGRLIALFVGAILGVVLTLVLTGPMKEWLRARRAQRETPEIVLRQAETERRRLTDGDLTSAAYNYETLLDAFDKNKSLDPATRRRLQALTYSGLSRTYADRSTLRYWRGLSRGDDPQRALGYALKATTIAPEMPDAEIALAYAYNSAEPEESAKSAVQVKVNELLSKGINNLDTRYLAWSSEANKKAESFPNEIRADDISDVHILADVGIHFAKLAEQATSTEKQLYISRSDEFIIRAAFVSPDNAIVLFVQGYLAVIKGNIAEARDYYQEAVARESEFPRARNNLGYTYAAEGDFVNAREQFEAAVQTAGAGVPTASLRLWLYNLGSASLEVGDNDKACQAWKQASEIPGEGEDPNTFLYSALCKYITGQKNAALTDFRRAVESGKKRGIDLTDISWYEREKAGPKELEISKALIQLAK